MNSVQLTQRLARNLKIPDVFNIPADAALDVLGAINAGLAAFYRAIPAVYKRAPLSATMRGPRIVNFSFIAQYSNLVPADTFEENMIGCTVRLGNGATDTEVKTRASVLDGYLGTDLGPIAATVYSDTVPLQDLVERVVGNILLYDNSQSEPTILTRDERLRGGRAWRVRDEVNFYSRDSVLNTVGRPEFYFLDAFGQVTGSDPAFALRVAPWPDKDYRVRFEAELRTQRIVFADLTTARAIYVADAYADEMLVPLCEVELITSGFWRDKDMVTQIKDRAEKILKEKIATIASDVAPSGNRVGTPPGF